MMTDKTLLEQMRISEIEIARRMEFLDLSKQDLELIGGYLPLVEANIEQVVEEFYQKQTEIDEIALLIGDSETLRRLRNAQHQYVLELFSGYYDSEYVNSRLRIGLVHKRIGVEPKLFLSAVRTLRMILSRLIESNVEDLQIVRRSLEALDKLMNFDVTLVFDTYIDTLVSEVEAAKRRMESYARVLEDKSKELESFALRDSMTNLLNKRGMQAAMRRELRLAQRRHTLLSILYIDVNKFKYINDTFGHATGDDVLIRLAQVMIRNSRSTDVTCRMGGDEFIVILPDCNTLGAQLIGEKISSAFTREYPDFSISFGIAETGPNEFASEKALIENADKKMYTAKVGHHEEIAEKRRVTKAIDKAVQMTDETTKLLAQADGETPLPHQAVIAKEPMKASIK